MKRYAGIGSRETPDDILKAIRSIGKYLASNKILLRSGGAKGADTAFEAGCDLVDGEKQIFLPYRFFNRNESPFFTVTREARLLAKHFHPAWEHLGDKGRDFMGRNAYQVLGLGLSTPVDFIVCWTKNGRIDGGTGQALRMADHYCIPIINLGSMSLDEVEIALKAQIESTSDDHKDSFECSTQADTKSST